MSINQRLKRYLKIKKLKATDLSDRKYANRITIGNYQKEGNSISSNFISKLKSDFPELDLNWLFTGEGEMILEGQEVSKSGAYDQKMELLEKEMKSIKATTAALTNAIQEILQEKNTTKE